MPYLLHRFRYRVLQTLKRFDKSSSLQQKQIFWLGVEDFL